MLLKVYTRFNLNIVWMFKRFCMNEKVKNNLHRTRPAGILGCWITSNLSNKYRWLISHTPRPLYTRKCIPLYVLGGKSVKQRWSERFGQEKISLQISETYSRIIQAID